MCRVIWKEWDFKDNFTNKIWYFSVHCVSLHVYICFPLRVHLFPFTCTFVSLYVYICFPSRVHLFPFTCTFISLYVYICFPSRVHLFPFTCTFVSLQVYICFPSRVHLFPSDVNLFPFTCTFVSLQMYICFPSGVHLFPSRVHLFLFLSNLSVSIKLQDLLMSYIYIYLVIKTKFHIKIVTFADFEVSLNSPSLLVTLYFITWTSETHNKAKNRKPAVNGLITERTPFWWGEPPDRWVTPPHPHHKIKIRRCWHEPFWNGVRGDLSRFYFINIFKQNIS